MSLNYAILGFLRYGPRTGYDLKKVFDVSVSHFWPAQQSQIYQSLGKLTENGFVECEIIPQTDRPNRKLFHITQEGEVELHRWLAAPQAEKPMRAQLLIQIFFAGELSDEEILVLLESKAAEVRRIIDLFEQGETPHPTYSKDLPKREQFFWYLTLDFGIENARNSLRWLDGAIKRIRNKDYEKGIDGALIERNLS
ncbi:PadR family transcriptional regulator [Candidatus Bipolaricaulota bacterium]|nr:PadR family transcriptional regulator [Candidatus Bipolaricaulota bacterium]